PLLFGGNQGSAPRLNRRVAGIDFRIDAPRVRSTLHPSGPDANERTYKPPSNESRAIARLAELASGSCRVLDGDGDRSDPGVLDPADRSARLADAGHIAGNSHRNRHIWG